MFADMRCVHKQEKDEEIEDLKHDVYLEELRTKDAEEQLASSKQKLQEMQNSSTLESAQMDYVTSAFQQAATVY